MPRRGSVRDGDPAQCPPLRSTKPWPSGANLRPALRRLGSLSQLRPRADGSPSAAGRSRMTTKRPVSGLGRGLSALMDESTRPAGEVEAPGESRGVREIEVGRIRPNPNQPRMHFSEEAIDELADSIGERGVLQPILLRRHGDGYEIIAGERRWRASQRARLHTIPAIVREIDDAGAAEIALIENIQREDLNAIEEAEG